jgi:hypothetical protein
MAAKTPDEVTCSLDRDVPGVRQLHASRRKAERSKDGAERPEVRATPRPRGSSGRSSSPRGSERLRIIWSAERQ